MFFFWGGGGGGVGGGGLVAVLHYYNVQTFEMSTCQLESTLLNLRSVKNS